MILRKLEKLDGVKGLCRAGSVNRALRKHASDQPLWRELCLRDFSFCDNPTGVWKEAYAKAKRLGRGWKAGDARDWKVTSMRGAESPVCAMAAAGNIVWVAHLDGSVYGYRSGKENVMFQKDEPVKELAIEANGVVGWNEQGVEVLREGTEAAIKRPAPQDMCLLGDEGRLEVSAGGALQLLRDNAVVCSVATNHSTRPCVSYSDGVVAVGSAGQSYISLFTLTLGAAPSVTLLRNTGHFSPCNVLRMQDRRLVSGHQDHCLRIWDTAAPVDKPLYCLLGGSLRQRDDNPPHPTRPGCSFLYVDYGRVIASFNAVVKNFSLVD